MPAELQPFIEKGTRALAVESADLDRDGTRDYVLVLERIDAKGEPVEAEEGQRPLLVIVRGADGTLRLAKRNDRVVLCSHCGGMMGDPFAGIEAKTGSITVSHYGGSAWRWSSEYRFDYSRIDSTWQLVRVTETNFHALDEARVIRERLVMDLTRSASPALVELERALGRPLPGPLARAREELRHAAEAVAREAAINQRVLEHARRAGEAFLQSLFSAAIVLNASKKPQ